eukprot:IDg9253t1
MLRERGSRCPGCRIAVCDLSDESCTRLDRFPRKSRTYCTGSFTRADLSFSSKTATSRDCIEQLIEVEEQTRLEIKL